MIKQKTITMRNMIFNEQNNNDRQKTNVCGKSTKVPKTHIRSNTYERKMNNIVKEDIGEV